ncbi:hypothetical protein TNCV_5095681 [Trichonephila clavipes]|nr:hypothetical protein TNCV_5095681 [Trichonephila clavipes]
MYGNETANTLARNRGFPSPGGWAITTLVEQQSKPERVLLAMLKARDGCIMKQNMSLALYTDVAASFYERVFFKTELGFYTNKDTQHPEYLRQLALETIHKIPCDVLQIYTDSSMAVGAVSGSGIFIKNGNSIKIYSSNDEFGKITLSSAFGENVEAKLIKTAIALDNNSLNHPMDCLVPDHR